MSPAIGLRWTIGDASGRGYEALRLAIWGAFRLLGPDAEYVVCVNRIAPDEARRAHRSRARPGGMATAGPAAGLSP